MTTLYVKPNAGRGDQYDRRQLRKSDQEGRTNPQWDAKAAAGQVSSQGRRPKHGDQPTGRNRFCGGGITQHYRDEYKHTGSHRYEGPRNQVPLPVRCRLNVASFDRRTNGSARNSEKALSLSRNSPTRTAFFPDKRATRFKKSGGCSKNLWGYRRIWTPHTASTALS